MQRRHFQTKFASPRLPGISCSSCRRKVSILPINADFFARVTYEAVEAHPVRVNLVARCAFHPEGVVVGVFLGVNGPKRSNTTRNGQMEYLINDS